MSPASSDRVAAVVRAATRLAREAGLTSPAGPSEDPPVVLDARANVVVALPGGALVARCPSRTDLLPGQDPGDPWRQANEVALARWLVERGAPVVPPAGEDDALPAGPHHLDGLVVTLWRRADPVPPELATPARYGQVLADLHAVAAGYPDAAALAPLGPAVADLVPVLAALDRDDLLPADLSARLHAACRDVATELLGGMDGGGRQGVRGDGRGREGWLALHGDAHPRNLLALEGRLVWNDLEDCCCGPVEWDLATMQSMLALTDPSGATGAAAVRAYGRDPQDPALLPFLRGRLLERTVWTAVRVGERPDGSARQAGLAAVRGLLDDVERD